MTDVEWILFLSQVPSSPSSIRVTLWRRMRAAGAVGLHNGAWALPCSAKNEQFARDLIAYVNDHGGNATIFIAKAFSLEVEAGLISAFTRGIEQDYAEFIDKCKAFLAEVETEIGQKKFTFAELEENEGGLHKLTSWLRKIRARDYLGSPKAQEAAAAIDSCRKVLRRFAQSVYVEEGIDVPENEIEYRDE